MYFNKNNRHIVIFWNYMFILFQFLFFYYINICEADEPDFSVVINNQPKKYTINIQHITNKPINIISVSTGQSIQYHADLEKWNRNQSIELTILPEILESGKENVKIEGIIERNEKFTLTIPISAFSQRTQTDPKNNNE